MFRTTSLQEIQKRKFGYGHLVDKNKLRIFRPKWQEMARGWRRLHNEELQKLYASPNIIRVIKSKTMRWAVHVARMGEMRYVYKIFVGKPEGKRPLGMGG
jgi:hypothetical protein